MTTMTPNEAVEAVALDGCQFCLGQKGGVPGNENRLGSIAACDYCCILARDAGLTIPTPPADHTDLIARLREVEAARADFVAKRHAMNAARPDPMHATTAERNLYDERYRADNEAERAMRNAAVNFAKWATDNKAADALRAQAGEKS